MKILIVGDTHGDLVRCKKVLDYALANDCKVIVILGDFGFFPNLKGHDAFINGLSDYSILCGIEVHWIKGNHENHEVLQEICGDSLNVQEIKSNIFYHPNGNVWGWDGVTFLAMGGAWSIDKVHRTQGVSWFPDEEISQNDIRIAYGLGLVEILLAHDSPITSNIVDYIDFYLDANTKANQQKLQAVVESVRPKIIFHGHFHRKYMGYSNYTDDNDNVVEVKTIGLDANNGQLVNMVHIFDTDEFKKEYLNE